MKFNKIIILTIALIFIIMLNLCEVISAEKKEIIIAFDETRLVSSDDEEGYELSIDESDWYGASEYVNYLIDEGYTVSKISQQPITHETLREFDILFILQPDGYYTPRETDAILKFVEEGGGLFLSQRYSMEVMDSYGVNRIAQEFGVSFANDVKLCNLEANHDGIVDAIVITEFESDQLTEGLGSVIFVSMPYIEDAGDSKKLAYTDQKTWADDQRVGDWGNEIKDAHEISGRFPVLSSLTYGKGRVIFSADSFFLANDWLPKKDNNRLALKIPRWLTPDPAIIRDKEPIVIQQTLNSSISETAYTSRSTGNLFGYLPGIIIISFLFIYGNLFYNNQVQKEKEIPNIIEWLLYIFFIVAIMLALLNILIGSFYCDPTDTNFIFNPSLGYLLVTLFSLYLILGVVILIPLIKKKKINTRLNNLNVLIIILSAFIMAALCDDPDDVILYYIFFTPLSIPNLLTIFVAKKYEYIAPANTVTQDIDTEQPEQEATPAPSSSKLISSNSFPVEISQHYIEPEIIGKGGFARVFRAKRKDGQVVAVKIPITLDESTGKSFIREISVWQRLSHENIVTLNDMNILPIPYLELEYVDGGSLESLNKPVEIEQSSRIIFNVTYGLKHAHDQGIAHRDLKPQNILLTGDMTPKITDWGLSKVIAESKNSSRFGYTPLYAAPEQISPKKFGRPDFRTDIYQMGVIFYELATGKTPFKGDDFSEIGYAIINDDPEPPSALNPEYSELDAIILKCLKKQPDDRYQTIAEFQQDLTQYLKLEYTKSLAKSSGDLKRSCIYCGDLVLIHAKIGDVDDALKYALDMKNYAGDEWSDDMEDIVKQLDYLAGRKQPIGDEFMTRINAVLHQLKMGR